MAKIWEYPQSREQVEGSTTPDQKAMWGVSGTEDESEVHALVKWAVPKWFNGNPIVFYRLQPQGAGAWAVEVQYGARVSEFQFDTTGGKIKLTHSRASRYYVKDGSAAIDPDHSAPSDVDYTNYNHAINVQQTGQPEGVEVEVPAFAFVIRRQFPDPLPDWYINALCDLTGCVNTEVITVFVKSTAFTFQVGELKYDGATGGQRGDEDWSISMRFSAEKNQAGLTFGTGDDKISNITKNGWEYLWIAWDQISNAAGIASLTVKPKQVCVEEVFSTADLSPLFDLKPAPPLIVFGPLGPGGASDPGEPGPTGPTDPDMEGIGEEGDTGGGDDEEGGGAGGIDQIGDIIVS